MFLMRPFFSYMGGKFAGHRYYPYPAHKTVIEPFAGSAGYSVHHPSRQVILYDIDPKLYGVWHYLIHVSSEEILRLPLKFDDVRECKIPQEAQWLIGFWINRGTCQPCYKPSAWMRKYPEKVGWSWKIRERIARQVDRIRHWKVFNKSYTGIGNIHATWYIDPPYQIAGARYEFGAKLLDYQRLAEWCKSRNGQIIVCENTGAKWLPFQHLKTMRGCGGNGRSGVTHEAIWTNRPDMIPEYSCQN